MTETGADVRGFTYGIGSFLGVLASSVVQVSNTTISASVIGTIAEVFRRMVVLIVVIIGQST